MNQTCDKVYVHSETNTFQGDEYTIENRVIKGTKKCTNFGFKTIGESILKSLDDAGERIAQIDGVTGKKRTFKDVKEQSIRLALWLKKEGIGSGDIVTLCSPNHPDVEIVIIAVFLIGAIYNAFPHDLDLMSARRCIKHIEPRVVFVHKNKVDVLREAATLENQTCKVIVLGEDEFFRDILEMKSFNEKDNFQVTNNVESKNICCIMPTSGTTGTPKFVCYSHESVMSRLSIEHNELSNINMIVMIYLCPEWTVYFRFTLLHLLLRNTKIFHEDFKPHETFRIIEKYKVNQLILNSYKVLEFCQTNDAHEYNLCSVSLIESGGNRLHQKTIQKMHQIFPEALHYRILGSTEAGTITKYTEKCRNPQSQGKVLPNVQLKIIDIKSGLSLDHNQVGEVYVKSPYTMVGYYKNPTETARVYDEEGWFHTGDEGYYDENGEIVLVGRLKDVIKYRGIDVHASYVEQILMSHPDVLEATVVGIPHDVYAEQPIACIRKVRESKVTDDDILHLTNGLEYSDTFKNSIIFIDEFPRTTNGKINKRILKEQLVQKFTS